MAGKLYNSIEGLNVVPYIAPLGGLKLNLPATLIADTDMSGCQNVYMAEGKINKRFGYPQFGNNLPLPGVFIGSDQFYLFGGSDYLLAITTEGIWKYTVAKDWETIMPSEVEDDCETTWMACTNVTVANEGTIKKVGSYSQKISPGVLFTTGLMAYHDIALGDKSTYGMVRLWIRSSISLAAGALQFCIDDTAGCGSPLETINLPALTANTWKLVFVSMANPAALTAIASLGLKATTDFGACDIYIDDIQFCETFDSDLAYDADSSDLCSFDYIRKNTEAEPWWIFTNGIDPLKKWTGTGAISDLIASLPDGVTSLTASELVVFKDHVLLLDVSENGGRCPQRVRWSDTSKPDDFLNGNASYQDLPGADWIKCGKTFKGDYVVIFKERSIWVGYATGDSDIFQFDQRVSGAGCAAAKTVESLGDELIFLGWDDVYVFNGIDYESVGGDIQKELFDTINPKAIEKCFGVIVEEQKEYWLFTPSTSSDYCDTVWVFNYDLNKWTKHKIVDFMSNFGYYEKSGALAIGDLVGTIGEQAWRFGDRTILEAAPITLLGDTSGYIYQYDKLTNNDDGVAIDAWFTTKDFCFGDLTQRFRLCKMDVYFGGGGSLDVACSTDRGVTWKQERHLAANAVENIRRAYWRLDADMVRFRFRNNTAGEHFSFREARIYWQSAGGRM